MRLVAEKPGINKRTVLLWTNKYVNRNDDDTLETLLNVARGRGCKDEIVGEAKTWLISAACTKPKDPGYSAETWTTGLLTKHIHKTAKVTGVYLIDGYGYKHKLKKQDYTAVVNSDGTVTVNGKEKGVLIRHGTSKMVFGKSLIRPERGLRNGSKRNTGQNECNVCRSRAKAGLLALKPGRI